MRGVGYQLDCGGPVEPEPSVPFFVEFGRQYVRDLFGITPATRHRYDRRVLLLGQQLPAVLRAEPTIANIGEVHVRRWVNAREAAGARPRTIATTTGCCTWS